jgi:uncharacterized protein YlaN (UPF0358 family)
VRDVLQKVVDLDNPAEWARLINERAKVFEKLMPIAFNNLLVAQCSLGYIEIHQDKVWNVRAEVAAVRRSGLCLHEAAEGRLARSEAWSFRFGSQVSRQWRPLSPRRA